MNIVKLVAKSSVIKEYFPEGRITSHIMSADFTVDPALCKTKFGKWLAENAKTTRFDDDFSILYIELAVTEDEIWFRQLAETISESAVRNNQDASRLTEIIQEKLETRKNVRKMYGDILYKNRTIQYQWPVFGANKEDSVEEYFDKCAGAIRAMKPQNVKFRSGAEIPASLLASMGRR